MTTPKLQLPELVVGQPGKELTHNQALAILSQLTQANVVDKDLGAPPASPADGSMYLVAASATGAWGGKSGQLAFWLASVSAWTFAVPVNGWRVWVADEAEYYMLKDGVWTIDTSGGGSGMTNPMTTAADVIVGGALGAPARLAAGTNGFVLTMVSGAVAWAASAAGFANPMTTPGDVIVGGTAGAPTRLAKGATDGLVLKIVSGAVAWAAESVGLTNPMTTAGDIIVGGTSGAPDRIAASTSTYVLTSNGAGSAPSWQAPASGGGGLTNWTDVYSSSAPNTPVAVSSLKASGAASTIDAALIPKADGAVLAAVPDGKATGGNKRGSYAVDWQTQRSNNTMVASGVSSFVLGGRDCTASGVDSYAGGKNCNASAANSAAVFAQNAVANAVYALALGGYSPYAVGTYSVSIGGISPYAAGMGSVVIGGSNNSTSFPYATAVGGGYNDASGDYASVFGGFKATTRAVYGAEARAAGVFSVLGDAQRARYILRVATANATPIAVATDGGTASSTNQIALPNNGTYAFEGRIVCRSGADQAAWTVKGLITRGANAAAMSIVGTATATPIAASAGAGAWAVALTANTALGCLSVTVTGAASTNIKWVADIETVEVVG